MKLIPIKLVYLFLAILLGLLVVYGSQRFLFKPNKTNNDDQITVNQSYPHDVNEDPYVLDISGQGLNEIPDFVLEHKHITHLIMNNNNISAFPDDIGKLTKIRVLDASNNQITGILSPQLLKMSLVDLKLSHNLITSLPNGIGDLLALRYVDLDYNQISYLPEELTNLQDLKWFNLANNPIEKSTIDQFQQDMLFTIFNY